MALVPPEPFYSEVERLKHEFFEEYNSKAALNSPPHITLHMPFRYAEEKEQKMGSALSSVSLQETIKIFQNGFGSFPPRVIYINVKPEAGLTRLQSSIVEHLRKNLKIVKNDYKNGSFHPHMTVAFRDLRPGMFKKAWPDYKERDLVFQWEAKAFYLLKHDGSKWGLYKEFPIT